MPGPTLSQARALTEAVQNAVKSHDRAALERLVDDRFVFTSSRTDHEIDKAAWINWACEIEWVWFEVGSVRTVDLSDVLMVESELRQRIKGSTPSDSSWLVSDLWVRHGHNWRLVARHPEVTDEAMGE